MSSTANEMQIVRLSAKPPSFPCLCCLAGLGWAGLGWLGWAGLVAGMRHHHTLLLSGLGQGPGVSILIITAITLLQSATISTIQDSRFGAFDCNGIRLSMMT